MNEPSGSEYGLVLRKSNTSPFVTKDSKKVDKMVSAEEESPIPRMVNIVSNASPSTRISFNNFDKKKENYIRQFSERTRPISETSPIKSKLEGIYSGGSNVQSKPNVASDFNIVFTTQVEEDEEKAKKAAAVQAMEKAFLKKKMIQKPEQEKIVQEVAKVDVESDSSNSDVAPVPAKRQSLKKKETETSRSTTEYRQIKSSPKSQPAIRIVEFGSSGTDYSNVTKSIDPNH